VEALFRAFDLNGNGEVDFDEFIRVVVGPMNQFRTQLAQKAYKIIDYNGDGVLDINDIKGKYDASKHPDVKSGKKTENEILKEFLETFEMHHNVMHNGKSDGIVTLDEFIEYYTNISSKIDNDAYFDLMMSNAWNLEGKNNTDNLAFAGSQRKVTQVSARDAWRNDHHRNLFGTDKETPFAKNKNNEWQTTAKSGQNGDVHASQNMQGAGSATFAKQSDYKMQFMTSSQRHTGVTYQGIQHTDDDLVVLFREKLASRGARGILGMQRIFKIMDDNRNG
jgi:Ca2+-binding EF-hand superfamily protein